MKPCFLQRLLFTTSAYLVLMVCGAWAQPRSLQKDVLQTDVLIVGGGASGTTAGIQAARLAIKALIVEETPWLGGMLTSAGVGAIDGNNKLPSGLWGEFRQSLRTHYGGANNIETGWVSNTLFEPHVGDSIWKTMARREEKFLSVQHGYYPVSVQRLGKRIVSVTFNSTKSAQTLVVAAKVVIDATELGDVLALVGAKYDVGMEARSATGEAAAPLKANAIIQDLTWVAVLKDFRLQLGDSADRRIPKPAGYDPREFNTCCKESCYGVSADSAAKLVDAQKMLDYGRLPTPDFTRTGRGAKYMLNWPRMGNDFYFNAINRSREERQKGFEQAKQKTLRFVYHIQTTLGFKYLGLSDDEFPTTDSLALIPYHREARRLRGVERMTLQHVLKPYSHTLYRTGIAVGDYPVDHHHGQYPKQNELPAIEFPAVPSFSIPLGSLLAPDIENLIAAEKCLSVSNIINGSTRLQPCVMLIGQAAGTLAALSVKTSSAAKQVPLRSVQQVLLDAKCWLLPFLDVPPESQYFQAVQKIGLVGVLQGTGVPYKWANQTWFYPDSTLTILQFATAAEFSRGKVKEEIVGIGTNRRIEGTMIATATTGEKPINAICSVTDALKYLWGCRVPNGDANPVWAQFPHAERPLTRQEAAQMLHLAFNPFERLLVDVHGQLLNTTDPRSR